MRERMSREDELVPAAYAGNRAEAEMIQALLDGVGIPSLVHQLGIDGPALSIAWVDPERGTHRVMVHAKRLEEARGLLAEALAEGERQGWPEPANATYLEEAAGRNPRGYRLAGAFVRIVAWSAAGLAAMVAIFLLSRVL